MVEYIYFFIFIVLLPFSLILFLGLRTSLFFLSILQFLFLLFVELSIINISIISTNKVAYILPIIFIVIGFLIQKRKDKYNGMIVSKIPNGNGEFIRASGYFGDFLKKKYKYIYVGEFLNGEMHGTGKMTYSNGDVYEGEFIKNEENGKGKITYSNGDIYQGEFVNGLRNGFGEFKFDEDNVYKGEWKDDMKNGKGKMKYKGGQDFEGNWEDNKFISE